MQIVDAKDVSVLNLRIRPTLASSNIFLDLPQSIVADQLSYRLIDLLGKEVGSSSFYGIAETEVEIPIVDLARGIYLIQFQIEGTYYQGKFMKI